MYRKTELIHDFNSILSTYNADINKLSDILMKLHDRLVQNEEIIDTLFAVCSEMHRRYGEKCNGCKYTKLCAEYNRT